MLLVDTLLVLLVIGCGQDVNTMCWSVLVCTTSNGLSIWIHGIREIPSATVLLQGVHYWCA